MFFEDLKVAHNDFGTKLPNYQLYQVFSHFFRENVPKKLPSYLLYQAFGIFLEEKHWKNYQITQITGGFIFGRDQ